MTTEKELIERMCKKYQLNKNYEFDTDFTLEGFCYLILKEARKETIEEIEKKFKTIINTPFLTNRDRLNRIGFEIDRLKEKKQ